VEQLVAGFMQRTESFFLQDLEFLSEEIAKHMNLHFRSSAQLFVLERVLAFLRRNFLGKTGPEISVESKQRRLALAFI